MASSMRSDSTSASAIEDTAFGRRMQKRSRLTHQLLTQTSTPALSVYHPLRSQNSYYTHCPPSTKSETIPSTRAPSSVPAVTAILAQALPLIQPVHAALVSSSLDDFHTRSLHVHQPTSEPTAKRTTRLSSVNLKVSTPPPNTPHMSTRSARAWHTIEMDLAVMRLKAERFDSDDEQEYGTPSLLGLPSNVRNMIWRNLLISDEHLVVCSCP